MGADADAPSPCQLRNLSLNGRRSEGARTFWYGPLSLRAPRQAGQLRLRRAQRGYRLCPIFFCTDMTNMGPHRIILS
eukprot:6175228-Pleurochrysis_carterae.AAC.2